MEDRAKEAPVLTHIQRLVEEEHGLLDKGLLGSAEGSRLAAIEVELDQCWDLLRQRRALRETGRSASEARLRPPDVVERYEG